MTSVAQSITVSGKHFVAGLFWQSLTRPRAYLQEAREIGRRDKMDVVAIRKGRVLQAGFARKSSANVGAYSLASTLAGILGDDWIGVFEVDAATELYAIVGTKNGAIIPGCDALGSRIEIEERLRADYNLHRFGRVFCPDDFGFGGEERRLSDVLASGKLLKEYKLASLGSSVSLGKLIAFGFAFLLLIGVTVGFLLYRKHQQEVLEAAAEAAMAAQLEQAAAQTAATAQAPTALPHPWATQPKAQSLRAACGKAIHGVPLSMGGWLVESASCNGGTLQMVFKRTGNATIVSVMKAAENHGYRVDSVDEVGDSANMSFALPALAAGGDDTLVPMAALSDGVKSLLQSRQIAYSIAVNPPPPPPQALPGEEPPPAPPAPDWQTSTFTVTGKNTPAVVMAGIEELPGVRLTTIAARRSDSALEWTLTGELHGK